MWAPSKNPDDYLVGQRGHPSNAEPPSRPPLQLTLGTYFGSWALVALLAHALGAEWGQAIMPFGLFGAALAQLATLIWWRRRPNAQTSE